jgi:hypothetical protein
MKLINRKKPQDKQEYRISLDTLIFSLLIMAPDEDGRTFKERMERIKDES